MAWVRGGCAGGVLMSGDWIKMRSNLWDDPKVARLCDLTDSGEAPIVGGLYWLWSMADQHTEDGYLPGLTLRQIDRKTAIPGFGAALCAVGWITDGEDGITIVRFTDHNGTSAKKRCQTAKRVAKHDSANAPLTLGALGKADSSVSDALAREEKRREEEKDTHTPLRGDWVLPKAWGEWAITSNPHWTPEVVRAVADRFSAHATSKANTSADWLATWQLWCSDPLTQRAHGPPKTPPLSKPAPGITVPSNDGKATQALLAERAKSAAEGEQKTPEQRDAMLQQLRETRQKLRAA